MSHAGSRSHCQQQHARCQSPPLRPHVESLLYARMRRCSCSQSAAADHRGPRPPAALTLSGEGPRRYSCTIKRYLKCLISCWGGATGNESLGALSRAGQGLREVVRKRLCWLRSIKRSRIELRASPWLRGGARKAALVGCRCPPGCCADFHVWGPPRANSACDPRRISLRLCEGSLEAAVRASGRALACPPSPTDR